MSKTLLQATVLMVCTLVLAGCTTKTPAVDTTVTTNTGTIVVEANTGSTELATGSTETPTPTNTQGEQTRQINLSQSVLGWKGSRVAYSYTGSVSFTQGELTFVDGVPTSGDFTIDMTSLTIANGSDGVLKHLSSDDFFAVATYPQAKLSIISGALASGTNYNITANLTIKDVTKPITFVAHFNQDLTAATGAFDINRTDWNIQYGSDNFFDGLGDKAISDTIAFDVAVSFE